MKCAILLFACAAFLDFTSAMLKRPEKSPPLPKTFPPNSPTYFFIQKKDGDVYFGYLNYNGHKVPKWAFAKKYDESDAVEHALVTMPNGDNYISIVKHLKHGININDKLPEEHRCFIFHEHFKILVAYLHLANQTQQPILTGMRIRVRIPDERSHRYWGRFEYYDGILPSWLRRAY